MFSLYKKFLDMSYMVGTIFGYSNLKIDREELKQL